MYTVIVADDEPMMRKAVKAFIPWQEMDCTIVALCKDGKETMQAVHEHEPDILVCDISMPSLSGIDVAKAISEEGLRTQVILLTAFADFSYAQMAVRYGVCDYVVKNGAMENLQRAIATCIQRLEEKGSSQDVSLVLQSLAMGATVSQAELTHAIGQAQLFADTYMLLTAERLDCPNDEVAAKIGSFINNALVESGLTATAFSLGSTKSCHLIADSDTSTVMEICMHCHDALASLMSVHTLFGISNVARSLGNLSQAYAQTLTAIDMGFYEETRSVFLVPTNGSPQTVVALDFPSFEQGLVLGQSELVQRWLDGFYEQSLASRTNISQMHRMGLLLLSCCRHAISGFGDVGVEHERSIAQSRTFSAYQAAIGSIVQSALDQVREQHLLATDPVSNAQRFIDTHYMDNITLTDVAQAAHVSDSYLSRVFRQRTGMTITSAINGKKVEVACTLLSSGSLRTYEVAQRVGFEDAAYFSNIFRKHTGFTPSQYRAARGTHEHPTSN